VWEVVIDEFDSDFLVIVKKRMFERESQWKVLSVL
jgi:hypothetical protein